MDPLFAALIGLIREWGVHVECLVGDWWMTRDGAYNVPFHGVSIRDGCIRVYHIKRGVVLSLELSDPEALVRLRAWLEREGLVG